MNNGFDLDTLRGNWKAIDTRLDDSLELDLARLRASLSQRMRSAFRRHSAWLLGALVFDALALVALVAFGLTYWNAPAQALSALALSLLMAMETATDVDAWRTLRTLDFDAPVLAVRARLAALRARRLRTTGAFILFSIALWFPFVGVLVLGLTGIDLFGVLHWSVFVGNLVFGLLFVPFGAWIGRVIARRFRDSAGYEQFLDDTAGKSWSVAARRWNTYADAEARVADGEGATLLRAQAGRDAPARDVAAPLRALRRALWLGIVLAVPPILAVALFNATHGGIARFLVPGLLLHFFFLAHLVANIAHLHAVKRLDLGASPLQLATAIDWMATRRTWLARWTLVLAPLFAFPLAIVIGEAGFGVDVIATVPALAQLAAVILAGTASFTLFRLRERFGSQLLNTICTGCLRRSRALRDALLAQHRDSG